MNFHPLANIFPSMSEAEFASLRADIQTHGVREPVWTYDGELIDGRHRWRACEELEIECPTREYEGGDPLGLVLSLNLQRRHLSESQRAMVAANIARLTHGGDRRSDQAANLPLETPTQGQAAEMLGVSERSVRAATKVRDKAAPELVEAVASGEVSVSAAAALTSLPAEEQAAVAKQGKKAAVEAAKRAKGESKPAKQAKPRVALAAAESAPLQDELKELRARYDELAAEYRDVVNDNVSMGKVIEADDKLAAAMAEIKRLTSLVSSLEDRIRGLMTEKNEAARDARSWQRRAERMQKAAA